MSESPVEESLKAAKRKDSSADDVLATKRLLVEHPEHHRSKLEKKLHHDARQVRKAAKKAKTFEIQKILKRMRDARHKGDDKTVKDIEAQRMALKHVNSDHIANSALTSRIKKDRILSQDPDLQSAMTKSLAASFISPAAHDSAASKVQSRLLSSKILAAEVSRIIEGLRHMLNPVEQAYGAANEDADVSQPPKKKQKTQEKAGLPQVPLVNEAGANIENEGWESGTVSDDGHSAHGEFQSVPVGEGSDAEETLGYEGDHTLRLGPDVRRKPKASTTQSTFLPSLSVGFIRGDSDTDFSEREGKAADGSKKNRRGQRARRAIWEKKYGRNANHVVKQRRAAGRSHCTEQRQHRSGKRDVDGVPFSDRKTRMMDKRAVPARRMTGTRQEEKSLHPSWEAKRKQQHVAIVPAQGTRIVFE